MYIWTEEEDIYLMIHLDATNCIERESLSMKATQEENMNEPSEWKKK